MSSTYKGTAEGAALHRQRLAREAITQTGEDSSAGKRCGQCSKLDDVCKGEREAEDPACRHFVGWLPDGLDKPAPEPAGLRPLEVADAPPYRTDGNGRQLPGHRREPCATCGGSGEQGRFLNREIGTCSPWASRPNRHHNDFRDCPDCAGEEG